MTPPMSASPPPEPAPVAPPAPRRWPRRLLWTLAALGVLFAAAPLYLGALARPFVVDALERELDAHCTLAGLSFSWPARLHLTGLDLSDAEGAPLASLDALDAALELAPLLGGELRAALTIQYPELHLARRPDGRWNWEAALEKALASPATAPREEPAGEELPRVALRLELADGHVLVHGPAGDTTLADIALGLELDGLDRPAPYRLAFGLRGPAGPAGRVRLEGEFTAAAEGKLEPAGLAGQARLVLESLDLAALEPAAGLVAPVTGLRGTAEGSLSCELRAGLALSGTSDLTVRGLELVGPRAGGRATRLESVRLAGSASQQGEGEGTQRLELAADDFLALVYEGRSNIPAAGAGALEGELSLKGDLARLAEVARGWVPLQEGVELGGRLDQRLELAATLADRAPTEVRVSLGGGLSGLGARDAAGRTLELGELSAVTLALEARADLAAGTLDVTEATLGAGPVRFDGHLMARGIGPEAAAEALVIERGDFHLVADLEALRGTLAALVTLGEESFGGRLDARGTLAGSAADGLALELELAAESLAFAGSTLESARGRFQARRGADGALGGSGEFTLGPGALAGGAAPLALPGLGLTLQVAEDAAGKGTHRLALKSAGSELTLDLAAHTTRQAERLGVTAELELAGALAGLARLAGEAAALPPGLAGQLGGRGTLTAELAGGTLVRAGAELDFALKALTVADAAGAPLALPALADTRLSLAARFDGAERRADVTNLALTAGGFALTSRATLLGVDPTGALRAEALEVHDGKLTLELDLARLGPELAQIVDLGGATLGGTPLALELDLAARAGRAEARGRLATTRLRYAPAEGAPLELAPLNGQFDLGLDLELGSLHVRTAQLKAGASTVTLAGTLNDLTDPARARGAVTLDLSSDLGRMLAELGLESAESGRHTTGKLSGRFQLDGDQGAFHAAGNGALEDFRLELAQEGEGAAPLVVEEPRIGLALDARISLAALDVELEKLTLDSRLARGGVRGKILNLAGFGADEVRFEGLTGELAYVPESLGAVLGKLLPGQWSGEKEERATFRLDGRARDFTLEEVLRTSSGRVDLGLGHFVRPEVALDGTLTLETREEKALLRGDLGANGGTLVVDGTLDLAATKPRSRLTVNARDVKANSGLAPLLALAHPAFAASSLTQGTLEGLIGLTLDVTYDGPLALDQLEGGWATLPKEPINGTGTLSLSGASLAGSPLLAALAEFGLDTKKSLELKPIEFTIKKGRLSYARPWTWTLGGAETSFTGSVGLDQTLALDWNLPITPELVAKHDFLRVLQGERISVPIRGTALAPRLDTGELLKDLATKAAKRALEQKLGLGGGKGAEAEDPDTLLKRADELWSKDQKVEAAKLYERLKEDYKLSLTYALNKDRIKDRAKYKP